MMPIAGRAREIQMQQNEQVTISKKDGTSYMVCPYTWDHYDSDRLMSIYEEYKSWLYDNEIFMTRGNVHEGYTVLRMWEAYLERNGIAYGHK